jgi:DNA-binding transcriptional LysR family regulator
MKISTKQLTGFVHAAQLGSFTRAAERLYVTQAGLSAIIRDLETQLGCRLFDRTTRTVTLTEAGRKFLPVALRTVEDITAAATELNQMSGRARQTLRVGATPLVACKLLPAVCVAFRRTHPELTVRVLELQRDRIQELVGQGELDVGLGIFLTSAAGVDRRRLFRSKLLCAAPLESARRAEQPGLMRWSELRDAKFVALQPDNPVQQFIEKHLRANVQVRDERYSVNHIETQIAMAEIGMGCAIIPSFALPACRHYKVRVNALTSPTVEIGFDRIFRKGREQPEAMEAFIQTLIDVLTPELGRK